MSEPLEFEVLTIFPQAIEAFVSSGIISRAIERELVVVRCTDPRAFTHDRHRSVDDAPFGGGAGMVMKPDPIAEALDAVLAERGPMHTILLTPSGARFDQRVAERLAGERRIGLLCGRYEGIDDRIREHFVDECLSIGDFVLNGGEVAAAVVIEAVSRLREGVLGNPESLAIESFKAPSGEFVPGLVVEHPHYTRPANFRGRPVPPVLLSGDHLAIDRWRRRTACLRTWALRPELRPRWRLPADHPIYLAVPGDLLEPADAEQLARLPGELGLPQVSVSMRDLKPLVRALGKKHGRAPWVIGVGDCDKPGGERGPRLILDVLAYEHEQAPPPLILWLGGPGDPALSSRPPQAWLALDLDAPSFPRARLALASSLIDIAQPQAARRPVVPLARAALQAMRAEGLLGSESSP